MPLKNYYEIFKIYPPIDPIQLQDAYKRLIFEYHPDRNPDRAEWALEHTMDVVEAYNVLSDPEKREIYNFQVKNGIRKEVGNIFQAKKSFLKFGKSKEEQEAEEFFNKGNDFFQDKDTWNQAQHEWLNAIKVIPGFVNVHYNLGILCGYQGNFKEAVNCFERALKYDPGDFEIKKVSSAAMSYVYGKKV